MPSANRDVAFLLGSGASIPSGYPSTSALTETVLRGTHVMRHTDGCYYRGKQPESFPFNYVGAIVPLLAEVKEIADSSLVPQRGYGANYEDILYVLIQLNEHLSGEIENPVLEPFLEAMRPRISECARRILGREIAPAELLEEAVHYIRDLVTRELTAAPVETGHLDRVFQPFISGNLRCYIATLNHDTHLDEYLATNSRYYFDGFGCPDAGVRYALKSRAPIDDLGVQIFKLHGSVNWYTLRPDHGDYFDERVGIPLDGDWWHSKGRSGQLQIPVSSRPHVVMGTFNKFADYHSSLFADLHTSWRAALERVDRLVISGYGFGDKGINLQIIDWVFGRRGRRILLIAPDLNALRLNARGAISRHWESLSNLGALRCLEMGFERCTSEELSAFAT